MSNISISVLMPVYNSEKFLLETVQAVINQSYINWELILVDDGSTDNSKEICTKLMNDDKRIKYIFQENLGVSHTRNVALENAQGKYIVFVDDLDDDFVEDFFFFVNCSFSLPSKMNQNTTYVLLKYHLL